MLGFFYKDRRHQRREPCEIRGALIFSGGLRIAGCIVDLSRGGCRFRPSRPGVFPASESAALLLPNARVECCILRRRNGHFHCRFNRELHEAAVTAFVTGEADELTRRLAASRLRF